MRTAMCGFSVSIALGNPARQRQLLLIFGFVADSEASHDFLDFGESVTAAVQVQKRSAEDGFGVSVETFDGSRADSFEQRHADDVCFRPFQFILLASPRCSAESVTGSFLIERHALAWRSRAGFRTIFRPLEFGCATMVECGDLIHAGIETWKTESDK